MEQKLRFYSMSNKIIIARQLEVMPDGRSGGKIVVPGCEPTSAVTSITLMRQQRCGRALVDLQRALAAIPGSTVYFGTNFGSGPRARFFVLPPFEQDCDPCPMQPDWFEVLRELANEELPVEKKFDACDIIGMGQCPSPEFKNFQPPEPSTYFPEGADNWFKANTP